MKHHWHEAAHIPDLADAAWAVARRFTELRDDDATGGVVLRRFESFTYAEVSTWWVVELGDGQVSDRPGTVPAER
ncbi:ATP-grasp domain-containing protein [Actinosynnema sp. CA-299493]